MAEYASKRDSDNLLSGNGDKNRTIGYQTVQVQRPAISKGPGRPAKKMARSPYLAVIDCMRAYIRRSQTKLCPLYPRKYPTISPDAAAKPRTIPSRQPSVLEQPDVQHRIRG